MVKLKIFSPKKGSQPHNEIGNMPLRFDETIFFAMRCHFQLGKCKNMKFFSYPKIFQNIQTAVSRLLLMPESSATAQIKGFCTSYLFPINTMLLIDF